METPVKPAKRRLNILSLIGLAISLPFPVLLCMLASSQMPMEFMAVPLFGQLIALALCVIGLIQIRRSAGVQSGRGFAIAGVVLGVLVFALVGSIWISVMILSSTP
jgi:hypothetical protein